MMGNEETPARTESLPKGVTSLELVLVSVGLNITFKRVVAQFVPSRGYKPIKGNQTQQTRPLFKVSQLFLCCKTAIPILKAHQALSLPCRNLGSENRLPETAGDGKPPVALQMVKIDRSNEHGRLKCGFPLDRSVVSL